jgi:hypothetical protein
MVPTYPATACLRPDDERVTAARRLFRRWQVGHQYVLRDVTSPGAEYLMALSHRRQPKR